MIFSISFLFFSSQSILAQSVKTKNQFIKNVKIIKNEKYYKGDFYSDSFFNPEEMVEVTNILTEGYMVPFAHMAMGNIEETAEEFIDKVGGGPVIEYYVTPPPFGQGEPYYCVDIRDKSRTNIIASMLIRLDVKETKKGCLVTPTQDFEISYKGKVYRDWDAVRFLKSY